MVGSVNDYGIVSSYGVTLQSGTSQCDYCSGWLFVHYNMSQVAV